MELLVGVGAVLSVVGIAGIILSIVKVRRAKTTSKDDEELRAKIQAAMPLNLGAFLLSILGLMCVVVGVILG
jgi:hypothetical protein